MFRQALTLLGESSRVRDFVTGTPLTRSASRRFVAGETEEDLLRAARGAREEGLRVTANYLGESVKDAEGARVAADEVISLLDRLQDAKLEVNISVKPSQLGMDVAAGILRENVGLVLDRAGQSGTFVRFDMESSRHTDATVSLLLELQEGGRRGIGAVLQAYLHRTPDDMERLIAVGIPIRLCKGAYRETPEVAHQGERRIRERFRELMRRLLDAGVDPAFATHDEALIRDTLEYANRRGIAASRFELQLLYGVRRDLQRELVERGYRVRVYIPYGSNWYPYLMRRLAERPENLLFMASSVAKESPLGVIFPGSRGLRRAGRR
jgi:proline dehydrogenase